MVIDAISDPILRTQAACIVWWDYFGGREVADRWPQLDEFRKDWRPPWEIDQPALESVLLQLGYHPEIAKTRSTLPTTMRKVSSDDESQPTM